MIKNSLDTYKCDIWLGLKEGYDGQTIPISEIEYYCQSYVNKVGLCVTITPSKFIYTDGNEDGVCIGLINYPRFPQKPQKILSLAVKLAEKLMSMTNQFRCTIVTTDKIYLLENEFKDS